MRRSAIGINPGSSPRMRGAHYLSLNGLLAKRIIPADAGSTLNAIRCTTATWDHPRGCGEHASFHIKPGKFPGSSPRMRGALQVAERRVHARGIIPADAGSTDSPTE